MRPFDFYGVDKRKRLESQKVKSLEDTLAKKTQELDSVIQRLNRIERKMNK